MSLLVELPDDVTAPPWQAVPETEPELQGDLWRYYHPWVETAVGAPVYDDELLIENTTPYAWDIWHSYHSLGTIFSQGDRRVRVVKSGRHSVNS